MVLPNKEIHKQSVKNYNDESELQLQIHKTRNIHQNGKLNQCQMYVNPVRKCQCHNMFYLSINE